MRLIAVINVSLPPYSGEHGGILIKQKKERETVGKPDKLPFLYTR